MSHVSQHVGQLVKYKFESLERRRRISGETLSTHNVNKTQIKNRAKLEVLVHRDNKGTNLMTGECNNS